MSRKTSSQNKNLDPIRVLYSIHAPPLVTHQVSSVGATQLQRRDPARVNCINLPDIITYLHVFLTILLLSRYLMLIVYLGIGSVVPAILVPTLGTIRENKLQSPFWCCIGTSLLPLVLIASLVYSLVYLYQFRAILLLSSLLSIDYYKY